VAQREDIGVKALIALLLVLGGILVPTAARAQPGGLATVVSHGPRTERKVALTFDDGAFPSTALRIAGILEARGVAATFLPNTRWVRESPSVWRAIADRGFPLANHTHEHWNLTHLSGADLADEISTPARIMEEVTGRPIVRVLRPPGGFWDDTVRAAAFGAGFRTLLMWDTSGGDTSGYSTSATIARNALRGTNGSIVLLHLLDKTAAALPSIIDGYRARGFEFVTVSEMLGLPASGRLSSPPADEPDAWTIAPLTPASLTGPQLSMSCARRAGTLHCAYEGSGGLTYTSTTGGVWTSEVVVPASSTRFAVHPSLAVDQDGTVRIAYVEVRADREVLRLATRAGRAWTIEPVEPFKALMASPSLAVAADGTLHLAFRAAIPVSGIYHVARRGTGPWHVERVTGSSSDRDPAVALDPAGIPHVLFHHYASPYPNGTYDAVRGATGWHAHRIAETSERFIVAPRFDQSGHLRYALQGTSSPAIRFSPSAKVDIATLATVTGYGDGADLLLDADDRPTVIFWRDDGAGATRAFSARPPGSLGDDWSAPAPGGGGGGRILER
jgi:peptidoglycan/xylan/chitin deacetylase (PgdA/CDA1 family)